MGRTGGKGFCPLLGRGESYNCSGEIYVGQNNTCKRQDKYQNTANNGHLFNDPWI